MFNFRVVSVVATGLLMLSAGSYVIADDDSDSDSDSDANEVSVEVEATNAAGYRLEVEAEGTGLGFINEAVMPPQPPLPSFFGDLTGEAELTDPSGKECEVEIVASRNGITSVPIGTIATLSLFSHVGPPFPTVVAVSIAHNDSMGVTIPPLGKAAFKDAGCTVPPGMAPILFPGDQTTVEIEEDD